MLVNYDTEKINAVLLDFYNATGIYMDLLRADFSSVASRFHWENNRYCKAVQSTASGRRACVFSDATLLEKCRSTKKPQVHFCHAGLCDVAAPIIYDDEIIGFIIFGQLKTNRDFSALEEYISGLGLDAGKMKKYYNDISLFDKERIDSVSNIASLLVKHLLLENMLRPYFDDSMQVAMSFINQNIQRELSVKEISRETNISKSVLYKKFHTCFGCTVGEYINERRIEKSAALLEKTDMSIEEISQEVGFSSASYYSKIFKKLRGVSPIKYKKSRLKESKNK